MENKFLDQLVILIVSESQVDRLEKHLNREGFHFTVINSAGGIGQDAQICLLIGFQHERLQSLQDIVRRHCRKFKQFIPTFGVLPSEAGSLPLLEAQAGGATIYMMDVERFEQF